ncbi:LysM domain receptor-like kinase 4 [Tanacetum coccineum]
MGANAPKEVKILQKFNHFNLRGLYGVCEHDRACYLVYEFMENDVAKGLQYLHNFASLAYVHKDINSSNILLSKALRAKISKFGLARFSDKDQNGNLSIKCPSESKVCLAPKYLETGFVSTKTDVYAFGVVLLELIIERKAVYVNDDDGEEVMMSEEVLSVWGDEKHATDKVSYLIDPRLQARHPLGFVIDQDEPALRMIRLAIACLEPEPSRRLCMNEIVSAKLDTLVCKLDTLLFGMNGLFLFEMEGF